jgi:hypothetical protein
MMLPWNVVICVGGMELLSLQRRSRDAILLMIIYSTVKLITDGLFLKAIKARYHSGPRKNTFLSMREEPSQRY